MTLELRTPPGLEGTLRKRSGRFLKGWDTCHFALERGALFFYPPGQAKANARKFELQVRERACPPLPAPPRSHCSYCSARTHTPCRSSPCAPIGSHHCQGVALRVVPPAEFSRNFCFSLTSGTETLVLQAATQEALELWCSNLCYSLSLANGGGLLSPSMRASAQLYASQGAPVEASSLALDNFSGLSLGGEASAGAGAGT